MSGRKVNIQMLSEQMVAESGILLEGGGRSVEVWKNEANKDEHLWDCVVGSYLLANMRGVEVQTDGLVRKLKGNTKRRKRRRYRSAE